MISFLTLLSNASSFFSPRTVRVLVLFVNDIGPIGAAAVAKGLKHNKSLRKLMINMNVVGDKGVEAFGETLTYNRSLRQLYLSDNNIGNAGVIALTEGLIHNDGSLLELNLSNNEITCDGAREMAIRLKKNSGLTGLWISGNPIGYDGAKAMIQEGLQHNFYLESIDLTPFEDHPLLKEEKEFYLTLNRAGRQLLRKEKVHASLWAYVLNRVGHDQDMVFYFLIRNPNLFKNHDTTQNNFFVEEAAYQTTMDRTEDGEEERSKEVH